MVFSVCLRTCRDAHDAEDATQAVFLALAVQCKSGNPVRHLPAWLRQVAKRTSLDVRKSRKRREAREAKRRAENDGVVHDEHNGDGKSNGEALDLEKVGSVLSEELAKLPTKYRLPLVSLYFGGLTREEIAEQLGLKPGALGVRLHRARAMLGERLKRRGAISEGVILSMGIMPILDNAFGHALTIRTSEAAAHVMLGHSLSGQVSANVLATMNGTFGAVSLGRMKVVASALLVLIGSVAGGGTAWANSSDAVPQILTKVRQWVERARAGITLPSLRFEVVSDAGDAAQTSPVQPTNAEVLAMAPRVSEVPTLPDFSASVVPLEPVTVAASASTPRANAGVPKTPGEIKYPVVARESTKGGSAPTDAASRVKPFERDSLAAKPGDVAPRQQAAAAGGGEGRSTANLSTESAEPVLAGAGSGNVKVSGGASAGSDYLASAAGVPLASRGHVVGPRLAVGVDAGTTGAYALADGQTLVAGVEDVGRYGIGTFLQTGGKNSVTQVLLGEGSGGRGTYVQAGGSIKLAAGTSGAPAGIVVGGAGSGTFLLGDIMRPGYIFSTDIPASGATATVSQSPSANRSPIFLVRATPGGYGLVRGWGRVVLADGTIVNNGQVVADGFGRDYTLSLSAGTITNGIDNMNGGANGWYAVNGGQLTMPASFNSVDGSFTWGENLADPSLDLVNSVRLVLQPPPDQLSVSLVSPDRTDVPSLPGGHSFIGVWAVDPVGQADVDGIDLTVRYDDLLAGVRGLEEGSLKLWYFQDGLWSRVTGDDFWLDADNHLIGGHVNGSIDYFAVSAPEPGSIMTIAFFGTTLLLRRRARG